MEEPKEQKADTMEWIHDGDTKTKALENPVTHIASKSRTDINFAILSDCCIDAIQRAPERHKPEVFVPLNLPKDTKVNKAYFFENDKTSPLGVIVRDPGVTFFYETAVARFDAYEMFACVSQILQALEDEVDKGPDESVGEQPVPSVREGCA